jgi:hypothetical protein
MPDAPAATPPAPLVPKITEDPRFERAPMVRQAMRLVVPQKSGGMAVVEVRETTTGGRLLVQEAGSAFEKTVDMNVRELRELAAHCNLIARRTAGRPEHRP